MKTGHRMLAACLVLVLALALGGGAAMSAAPAGQSRPAATGATQPATSPAPAASQPASGPASIPAGAPVVRVEANAIVALHDLGVVRAGSEYFVVYAVENAKEGNVAIRQIRPDCECISALQPPAFLAARGETRITARFVPPKVNDVYGSELIVRTDDPQRKTIRLRILCRVVP